MSNAVPPPSRERAPRRTPHFVSREPWDPYAADKLGADQEKYYMAGQWKLMW